MDAATAARTLGVWGPVLPGAGAQLPLGAEVHVLNEEELSPIALSAKKVLTKLLALSAVGDRAPWWAVRFW